MWISKSELKQLKKRLAKLEWIVVNPCPYKVGDKIAGSVITDVWLGCVCFHEDNYLFSWNYSTINKHQKPKI